MVLLSRISAHAIGTDERVAQFALRASQESELENLIALEKVRFLQKKLFDVFNWDKPVKLLEAYSHYVPDRSLENKRDAMILTTRLIQAAYEQRDVAEKFKEKLPQLISDYDIQHSAELNIRITKAVDWFGENMQRSMFIPLVNHLSNINNQARIRKYYNYVVELIAALELHLKNLFEIHYGDTPLYRGDNNYKQYIPELPVKASKAKADTAMESLYLYQQGLSVEEIVHARGLTTGTILRHLLSFIETGETTLDNLVSKQKVEHIKQVVKELETTDLALIRGALGKAYDYTEVKIVLAMITDVSA